MYIQGIEITASCFQGQHVIDWAITLAHSVCFWWSDPQPHWKGDIPATPHPRQSLSHGLASSWSLWVRATTQRCPCCIKEHPDAWRPKSCVWWTQLPRGQQDQCRVCRFLSRGACDPKAYRIYILLSCLCHFLPCFLDSHQILFLFQLTQRKHQFNRGISLSLSRIWA